MKKFINKINSKATELAIRTKSALASKSGEGYIDTAVKIIIGVVVGGVILVGLYTLRTDKYTPCITITAQRNIHPKKPQNLLFIGQNPIWEK